ncbi:MAG: 2-hydroxyacyl-CoA dehydratase [Desulfobacterium sp.]|nr:2-hydroxyacyl-CoA dehydratase [Desulfobacterium sp.]MBU3950128.1 2-hydroxyacyl-CoA dehydratase family protein [Pseudomonadota bacterium]MBU4034907.1 2-hydroxyacyl-CoA dehydratase family protein [Pseudomonadota bacterium]
MEAINKIKAHLKSGINDLKQAKDQGIKIIGYVPGGYFPEELAIAAGAMPVCLIRAGDHASVEASIAYIDRWLDTFYRAQIGSGVSGKDQYYNIIDVMIAPITDSNNRALSDTLDYHTDIDIFPFGVPHKKEESGYQYYLHGLKKVKAKLEQLTGVEITEERLKEAIQLCNKERELLRKISLMRKSEIVPISAKDFVMINHAAMIIDKKVLIECMKSLIQELQETDTDNAKGPRLLLTGSTLAMGDGKILDLIEEAGGNVVIEEFAEGIKPYWQNVNTSGDLLEALAQTYFMDRIVPAWFRPASERLEYLVKLAKDFSVDGVVWYQLMYRESYKIESYYFPDILEKETGLSMLTLESDYDPSEIGQMRTRIETYLESIRR